MRTTTFCFLFLLGLALSGCASMSKDECRAADWQQVGQRDGASGYDSSRLDEHRKACAEVAVVPDALRWQQGWLQGLPLYCTAQVGWREGRAGNSYRGVCKGRSEEAFLQRYRIGSEANRVERQMSNNASEINRLENQIRKAASDEERRSLRDRLRYLNQDQLLLRQSLNNLQFLGLQP
jgi:hypothetical protein